MNLMNWIPSLVGLFIAGFNTAIFIILKFNDLRHIGKALDEIKVSLREQDKKADDLMQRVSNIEGRLDK